MRDISIRDLADLVAARVPEAGARLQKMFEWHFHRDLMITKWVLGAAASLAVALVLSFLKAEISLNWWQSLLFGSLPLAASSYGIYRLYKVRSIHRQFVAALKIHSDLSRIEPFISRYRSARETDG